MLTVEGMRLKRARRAIQDDHAALYHVMIMQDARSVDAPVEATWGAEPMNNSTELVLDREADPMLAGG